MGNGIRRMTETFCLTDEDARKYLGQVQAFFVGTQPAYQEIVSCILADHPSQLLSAWEIAIKVRQSSWGRVHNIKIDPDQPGRINVSPSSFKKKQKEKGRTQIKQKIKKMHSPKRVILRGGASLKKSTDSFFETPSKDSHLEPGLEWHSLLDKERVPADHLDHCPHGIQKGKICAICDPEEFKNMVGIE